MNPDPNPNPNTNCTKLKYRMISFGYSHRIIDIESVLSNRAGTQIEKKKALINPTYWICPRSGQRETRWGESAILNFNVAPLVYLKIDRSSNSVSIISMVTAFGLGGIVGFFGR